MKTNTLLRLKIIGLVTVIVVLLAGCPAPTEVGPDPLEVDIASNPSYSFVVAGWSWNGKWISCIDASGNVLFVIDNETKAVTELGRFLERGEFIPIGWNRKNGKLEWAGNQPNDSTFKAGFWAMDVNTRLVTSIPLPDGVNGSPIVALNPVDCSIAYLEYNVIYLVPDTGGIPVRIGSIVSENPFVDATLSWSPDGLELGVSIDNVYALRISDKRVRTLIDRTVLNRNSPSKYWTNGRIGNIAWSPDGRYIAFNFWANEYNDRGIYLYSIQDSAATHFVDGGWPAWSPDSRWIAYNRDQHLWKKKTNL